MTLTLKSYKPEEIAPWGQVYELTNQYGQKLLSIGFRNKNGQPWIGIIPNNFDGVAFPAEWLKQIVKCVNEMETGEKTHTIPGIGEITISED
jgi:hypothetical protein